MLSVVQKYGMTSLKQNLVKGSTGMVEVNLKGFPQPTFDWKKDGKRIPQIPRYKVAENGSLLISNVNISDSGTYSGVASQGGMDVDLDTIVVNVIGE